MAKVQDCKLGVFEFELLSNYYVHFQTNTPGSVVANVLFYDIVVSEFDFLSGYHIYFWTNTFDYIAPPLFFKNGFSIKRPTKVDILLNKEKKKNYTNNNSILNNNKYIWNVKWM